MGPKDVAVGMLLVDGYDQEWEISEIVQGCHLRLVDPSKPAPRYIHAANWPTWRTWTKKESSQTS